MTDTGKTGRILGHKQKTAGFLVTHKSPEQLEHRIWPLPSHEQGKFEKCPMMSQNLLIRTLQLQSETAPSAYKLTPHLPPFPAIPEGPASSSWRLGRALLKGRAPDFFFYNAGLPEGNLAAESK